MLARAVEAVGAAEELSVAVHSDSGVTVRSQHPGFSNALALKVVQSSLALPPQEFDKFIIGTFGSGGGGVKREQGAPAPPVHLALPVKPVWAFLQLIQSPPVASDSVSFYFHGPQIPALLSTDQCPSRPYYVDMVLATVDSMSEDAPPAPAAVPAAANPHEQGHQPQEGGGSAAMRGGGSPDSPSGGARPLSYASQAAPIRALPPPQSQPRAPSQAASSAQGADETLQLPSNADGVSMFQPSTQGGEGGSLMDGNEEQTSISGVSPIRRSRGVSSAPAGGVQGGSKRLRSTGDSPLTGAHTAVVGGGAQDGGASYASVLRGGGVSQSPTQDSPSQF